MRRPDSSPPPRSGRGRPLGPRQSRPRAPRRRTAGGSSTSPGGDAARHHARVLGPGVARARSACRRSTSSPLRASVHDERRVAAGRVERVRRGQVSAAAVTDEDDAAGQSVAPAAAGRRYHALIGSPSAPLKVTSKAARPPYAAGSYGARTSVAGCGRVDRAAQKSSRPAGSGVGAVPAELVEREVVEREAYPSVARPAGADRTARSTSITSPVSGSKKCRPPRAPQARPRRPARSGSGCRPAP